MPENAAAIVIDIGTTNCKVACFSRRDASRLDERKFVTPKITSPTGNVDFDIDALWQQVVATMRSRIARLRISVLPALVSPGCFSTRLAIS